MLSVEQRRIVDGEITKEFLRVNRNVVDQIITEFGRQAGVEFAGYHFYLKGGNALAMLQGEDPAGDYDFQLMPDLEEYENWPQTIEGADQRICRALSNSLQNIQADRFDESMFDIVTLAAWCQDERRPLGRAGISFAGVGQGQRRQSLLRIGTGYGIRTYEDIVRDPHFRNGRLELGEDGIQAQRLFPDNGPMIYVNYTIPGFILFRMAYSFRYTDEEGQVFSLKSEIIDVSVPRKGSAEVYLSQEGVITHFRPSGRGFNIPGWGYHFYENINLLQEIQLGISGSPHKRQKRLERGGQALAALQAAGGQALAQALIWEPEPEGRSQILGYLGALVYNVDDYGPGAAGVNRQMVEILLQKLIGQGLQHFETVKAGHPTCGWLELFYRFRLDPRFDTAVKRVPDVKDGVSGLMRGYNSGCFGVEELCLAAGKTYRFLTPYEEIGGEGVFPLDYGVAGVRERAYDNFYAYCRRYHGRDVTEQEGGNGFLLSVHCKGGIFYIIFQNCGAVLTDRKISLSRILQRCILESQRCKLAQYMEKHQ